MLLLEHNRIIHELLPAPPFPENKFQLFPRELLSLYHWMVHFVCGVAKLGPIAISFLYQPFVLL